MVDGDLGTLYTVSGTEVMWEMDGVQYGYKIDVSPNNVAWTLAVDKTNDSSLAQTRTDLFTAKAVRYVRITVTRLAPASWASFWILRCLSCRRKEECTETIFSPAIRTWIRTIPTHSIRRQL